MLYKNNLKQEIVSTLKNRVEAISSAIIALLDAGYIPNKNKTTILNWSSILIDAYENIDILSKEQQDKLDNLFNKVIKL